MEFILGLKQSLKFWPFSFDISVNSATDPILKYGMAAHE